MVVGVLINQNDGFVQVVTTAGQTNLDFDFPLFRASDLTIIRTRSGIDTTLALFTDYTVPTGSLNDEDGGTAVLNSGANDGDKYTLLLDVPEARTTDYSNAGDFDADTLNLELDLEIQMIQQLRRDLAKSLRFADSSATTGKTVPEPDDGKVLGWNGTTLENLTPNSDTYLTITPYIDTLLDDADAATARTTLGAQQTLSGASLTAVTVATDDKVLIQDTSDSNNLKTVTTAAIAALAQPTVSLLNKENTATEISNTVGESTLYTFTVPASTTGTTGILRFKAYGDYLNSTGSPATLTFRLKFGGTTIITWTDSPAVNAARRSWEIEALMSSVDSAASQVWRGKLLIGGIDTAGTPAAPTLGQNGNNTSTVNTASDQAFTLTVQHGTVSTNIAARVRMSTLELL